jgi:glycosyltransferase involved in cell wall biosynthesis
MMNGETKTRICFVAVVEISVKAFLIDHFKTLSHFFDISVCVNTKDEAFLRPSGVGVTVIPIRIERKISPLSDAGALLHLYRIFRRYKFDVVHSIMPKSGLLSMLAAFFAGIPVRIHTFTGQVWATKNGPGRWFLKTMDRILAACATHILVDSQSQRTFLIEQGVVSPEKSGVIAEGSICGVDSEKFSPNPEAKSRIRRQYGIPESDIVFLYLGRLNLDKGLLDLAGSFSRIGDMYGNAHLVIVGSDEQMMKERIQSICVSCSPNIHFEDFTDVPEQFIAAADVLCLPSYREGFGVVIIQAASAGIPSIGSRIYGVTDTIEDGVTGLFFKAGDPDDLALKMKKFLDNPETIKQMGAEARKRALRLYSKERVTAAMLDFYRNFIAAAKKRRTVNSDFPLR